MLIIEKIKQNPWILSTLVLGILAIILVFSVVADASMAPEAVGKSFVDYINEQGGANIEYVSAIDFSPSLYQVNVLANGQEVPAHITKDGLYMVQVVMPLSEQEVDPLEIPEQDEPAPVDVVKSDKPKVELFVMSHCPYGTQAVKGIIPVLETLGKKIDFDLRFVYYAMHPTAGEVEEQLNQYCIQKEQEDKLVTYLKCFLDKGDGASCLDSTGIDKAKLTACAATADEEFNIMANLEDESGWLSGRFPKFDIDKELNEQYGVKGSPNLIINGKSVNVARSPSAYLDAICGAFNVAPEECLTELSSQAYQPGFGYDYAGDAGSAAQCG